MGSLVRGWRAGYSYSFLPTSYYFYILGTYHPEEFAAIVAFEDLDFVWGLSLTDRQILFVDVSHTLFKVGSLVSIIVVGQDDILGSIELSRERDELRETCEAVE